MIFKERKSNAERLFQDTYDSFVLTPALLRAKEQAWTMNTDVNELTIEQSEGKNVRFISGAYEFLLTEKTSKIFEDDEGRCGYARLLDYTLGGATIAEWTWDAGIVAPPHFHSWREVLLFIEGTWQMEVDGVKSICGPESVLSIRPNKVHSGICMTDTKLISISIPELG